MTIMKFPSQRTLALVAVAVVLAAWVSPLGAADIFRARMLTGKAPVEPSLITIQIEITSWTTPDEVRDLQRVLNEKGPDAFLSAFSGVNKGVVRFMYSHGFNIPVHAALTVPTEKGKKILLFFNRQQWDPGYQKSMGRNLFMAIELKLNAKGKGEGRFYEDAQIRLEPQEGLISVETYDGSPKIFPQVQEVVKKVEAQK
jgi:hypothetical protein